jgi:hypothetical protein
VPITEPEQATPSWLTDVLRADGCLDRGTVLEVRRSSRTTATATVHYLQPAYSPEAPASAPSRLFLKISRPDAPLGDTAREAEFYTQVAAAMPDPPSVRCYEAAFWPESGRAHILLEDLSASHVPFDESWSGPVGSMYCKLLIERLAAFHAFWWNHPKLGEIDELPTDTSLNEYARSIARTLPGFLDEVGEELPTDGPRLLERAAASLPGLWLDSARCSGVTATHGDAHMRNALYPKEPQRHLVHLIDWQFWNIGLGPNDLAFMIALHADRTTRRATEMPLTRCYHQKLQQSGVHDYGWEQCWHDYRVSVVHNLFTPMWQWSAGLRRSFWQPGLDRILRAFEDLKCRELLQD